LTSDSTTLQPTATEVDEPELIVAELDRYEREVRRREFLLDPVVWAKERLGAFLWSKQREILLALRDHRKVAVASCHGIGKSFVSALAVGHWIDTHTLGEAFVVTSAPTNNQVKSILWREIGRVHSKAKLRGRTTQKEWYVRMPSGNEELVAMGRKPDDYEPGAFQGIHARYVLYLFDEAGGMSPPLWEAADSLLSNDDSKALAVGNPDDPTAEFANICKPGSGWHVIHVGAFETPNFTGEAIPADLAPLLTGKTYVEEKRRKWAPQWVWSEDGSEVLPPDGIKEEDINPIWSSKVLGKFPANKETGSLIPLSWILAAQKRTIVPSSGSERELGVDVGGGGDSSAGAFRHGPVVRIKWEDNNPDTMQTCGNAVATRKSLNCTVVKVDEIGIGRGVVDRAKEQQEPFIGINVGAAAQDPEAFVNRRAELWWQVRERFESGEIDIDPNDDDLAAELAEIRYKRTSGGKIQIESKDEAKRRGIKSPNRADALMLSFAQEKKSLGEATW